MDQEKAKDTIENLLDRIEQIEGKNQWKLEGIITEKELKALKLAYEALGGDIEKETNSVVPPVEISVEVDQAATPVTLLNPIHLNLDSLSLDGPENPDVLLCLDFGTAMSKAFATEESDEILLDLQIGRRAGQTEPIFSLMSSVFITNSGKILFGHQAIAESTHIDKENRKRFDSIKDILCKAPVCNLDESTIDRELNPTDVPLSKGDMVTLFLAFFTDMAVSELQSERFNLSRYVRRRFTRPVLPPDRAPWAEDELKKLLARAQILGDTLHGQWQDGIDTAQAKQVLDEIKNLEEIPSFLIDEGVVEPVAAIGSRVRNYVCSQDSRRLLMVVDVGAGTIDFALFAEVQNQGKPLRVWEVPKSIHVLRQAGDMVDKLLRRYILKKADISSTDSDFHMIDADISLRIRQWKEELFKEEILGYSLSNDASGEILLNEFLEQPGVKELEKAIHEKFREVLNDVHPSWIEGLSHGDLWIIFTGGGADLPMVRKLADGQETIHNIALTRRGAVTLPKWVTDEYPELEKEFPHLAVAIGGASRGLPELAPTTFEEFGGLQVDGWTIETALKGV